MKTLRFALIAAILSFAMISYAGSTPTTPVKKVVHITLAQALTEPGLVAAMYEQLSMSFLKLEQPGFYSATVKYTGAIYKIYATREAWVRFFINKPVLVSVTKLHQ